MGVAVVDVDDTFDDRYAAAKCLKSRVWSKVSEGSTRIFGDTQVSL